MGSSSLSYCMSIQLEKTSALVYSCNAIQKHIERVVVGIRRCNEKSYLKKISSWCIFLNKKDSFMFEYAFTIGQDSHRFIENPDGILVLGGFPVRGDVSFAANSDGDVFLHALTNAVSGLTGRNILGAEADRLCLEQGITDSRVYLEEALKDLKKTGLSLDPGSDLSSSWEISRISFSVEGKKPHLAEVIPEIKKSVAEMIHLSPESIGITATTGEGLSDVGRGLGMMVFCGCTFRRFMSPASVMPPR